MTANPTLPWAVYCCDWPDHWVTELNKSFGPICEPHQQVHWKEPSRINNLFPKVVPEFDSLNQWSRRADVVTMHCCCMKKLHENSSYSFKTHAPKLRLYKHTLSQTNTISPIFALLILLSKHPPVHLQTLLVLLRLRPLWTVTWLHDLTPLLPTSHLEHHSPHYKYRWMQRPAYTAACGDGK